MGKLRGCTFSISNVIKVENRSLLSNEMLDDLLLLNTNKMPLQNFNADKAIELWWNDDLIRAEGKSTKNAVKVKVKKKK